MSVSGELLCSFELIKPLDSSALKKHIKKGQRERQNMLNSPVSILPEILYSTPLVGIMLIIDQPASQYPQSY